MAIVAREAVGVFLEKIQVGLLESRIRGIMTFRAKLTRLCGQQGPVGRGVRIVAVEALANLIGRVDRLWLFTGRDSLMTRETKIRDFVNQ